MSLLVDSHCHLTLLEPDINDIFSAAGKNGVGHMLCVCVDLETFPDILNLAQQYPQVSASVGLHPNSETVNEPSIEELTKNAIAPEVVAIGETGLDYYRSQGDLGWQQERFRRHIRAARICRKPLIIHNRESSRDLLRVLQEEGADAAGGVMHCFVDDWPTAKQAMDLNFYISFSGILTFKNARPVQEVAKKIPSDRLLVETDSPYLAPVPYRGKANQPAYVRYTAEFLAQLRGVPYAELAQQTTDNFYTLFPLARRPVTIQ
ncbi:MAG: TatD family hydrolase [Gammaproteobacteria bacterium]